MLNMSSHGRAIWHNYFFHSLIVAHSFHQVFTNSTPEMDGLDQAADLRCPVVPGNNC
jgi:hypothetical protein